MIVSSALWLNNILKKRNIGGNAFLKISSISVAIFVLTVLSFYFAGLFGPANTYRIFGMEKIIFGSISGAVVSFTTFFISNKIKNKNEGRTLFNYQTMVLTFGALIINVLIISLLIGMSITGIYYFIERKIGKRNKFKMFRLPFILTLVIFAYYVLTLENIFKEALIIAGLWLVFIFIYFYNNSKFIKKLLECCKE